MLNFHHSIAGFDGSYQQIHTFIPKFSLPLYIRGLKANLRKCGKHSISKEFYTKINNILPMLSECDKCTKFYKQLKLEYENGVNDIITSNSSINELIEGDENFTQIEKQTSSSHVSIWHPTTSSNAISYPTTTSWQNRLIFHNYEEELAGFGANEVEELLTTKIVEFLSNYEKELGKCNADFAMVCQTYDIVSAIDEFVTNPNGKVMKSFILWKQNHYSIVYVFLTTKGIR